jgi:hypothetical protein
MSRSGYNEDYDIEQWDLIRWRGAVAAAIRGKRGQAFLLEMWKAITALPEPKLIANNLVEEDGAVCAMGAVARARGIDLSEVDPEDCDRVADIFGIPHTLAKEIAFMNDDDFGCSKETPEERWKRMKLWAEQNLRPVEMKPDEIG